MFFARPIFWVEIREPDDCERAPEHRLLGADPATPRNEDEHAAEEGNKAESSTNIHVGDQKHNYPSVTILLLTSQEQSLRLLDQSKPVRWVTLTLLSLKSVRCHRQSQPH